MNSSLEKLVKNLSDNDFKYLSKEFNPKHLKLVKQKELYPYEHMDSFERFSKDKLPDKKKHFYRFWKNKHISKKDYLHAVKIWNNFKMKNMRHYHHLYLQTDVLLLADVFEKFINRSLEFYKLHPSYYFSPPGLSWDAAWKMTEIKLKLIYNIDKYNFVEKGLRGGISYISKRFREANNKYIKNYDPVKEIKYIKDLDAKWKMENSTHSFRETKLPLQLM